MKGNVKDREMASFVAQKVKTARNARDPSLIPGSGRSSAEGNGYPLKYCCLENSMNRGAWRVAKSQT